MPDNYGRMTNDEAPESLKNFCFPRKKVDKRPFVLVYNTNYDGRIKNVENLPHGTGAKYMLCLIGDNGDFIAKKWCRREPKLKTGEMAFRFPG